MIHLLRESIYLQVVHTIYSWPTNSSARAREDQSLHAEELNAIRESKIHKETLKLMFKSNDVEDENIFESNEEPLQLKPQQPRFMTPLCHATASSETYDLPVIHTPTAKDLNLKALVDSGTTKNIFSDSYAREKILSTHSLANLLRI